MSAAAPLVVKLGGTTIAGQEHVLDQVAAVSRSRPVVVVHGGGKRVSAWLERLGVPTRFEDGLRVTDEASLEVTAAVLRGAINVELVAALSARGCHAVGLSGVDGGLLVGERVPGKGLVASITGIRHELLDALLAGGSVPVIAPLAADRDGVVCNVNADDAAAGIARGLGGARLVLLTDVEGIRGADGARIASIDADGAEALIADGVIAGGMIPKVRAALRAVGAAAGLASGPGSGPAPRPPAREAVIANGADPRALERAIGDVTFGTRITARPARAATRPRTQGAAHPA